MSEQRHFKNDKHRSGKANAHSELGASLTRINIHNPPVQTCSTGWHFDGLYYGPTSIAYLFLRLSSIYPDLEFKNQSLLDWAQAYLELGANTRQSGVDPDHCGIANETLAQLAIQAVVIHDSSLAQKLCSYANRINTMSDEGSNEWLYGRAGYLYYLRLVKQEFGPEKNSSAHKIISDTIDKTVERILVSPQPWQWHGKAYLGAVHGSIGIICQIVLSSPSAAPKLETLLTELLKTQFASGNFPSSFPPGSDRLVQFCHGGPGFIICLQSLRAHFPRLQSKIDSAISAARKDVWKRGLLTKEPCLCHGIPTNALALDDDAEFEHFLSCMSSDTLEDQNWLGDAGRSDKFASLYTGEAGRAWTWAVADKRLNKACIGFNDL